MTARPGLADRILALRWPVALGLAACLVAAWQLAVDAGGLPASVASPTRTAAAVADLVRGGELDELIAESLRRAMSGFALGVACGAVLGLLAGVSHVVEDLVDPPLALTYAIPKVALFPALAVWLGFGDRTRIVVIFLVCLYPVYLNAHHGARGVDPQLLRVARNCGASRLRTVAQVVVPAALPRLLVGIRISLALSFVMLFATEVIGFGTGLGSFVYRAYLDGRFEPMYAGIVVLGLLGFLFDAAFGVLARRLTRGQRLRAIGAG